ncbi:MAG: aminoacetone oxidase family FAD-binding enzyme [Firmicutes bacterium]|nr:aminoacetone oxidase family FAD-binding enzyme [Bacillota bacterium]
MQNVLKDTNKNNYYKTILIGTGAAGLYFGAGVPCGHGKDVLMLEKTARPAMKLLMAGSGQCNVTHGGSIKDFLDCYGDHGSRIRTCLYKHNNLELMSFLESLGVPLTEREDGKVFPASMDAHDVKKALMEACAANGAEIRLNSPVTQIKALESGFEVIVESIDGVSKNVETYTCTNLVVATGGCSYPTTGSDGSIFRTLRDDLGLKIEEPRPALTPVSVQDYQFGELSGISLKDIGMKIAGLKKSFTGDLLFTHKNLSGPVIINNSRYITTGSRLELNFVYPENSETVTVSLKKAAPGSSRSVTGFLAEEYGLPKRFVSKIVELTLASGTESADKKLSALSGKEISALACSLAAAEFSVSGLGGFNVAMVTKGGVSLDEVSLKTMESKRYPGLYFIGEVLDIDGDTGGYNLQFAYSSAMATADNIFAI